MVALFLKYPLTSSNLALKKCLLLFYRRISSLVFTLLLSLFLHFLLDEMTSRIDDLEKEIDKLATQVAFFSCFSSLEERDRNSRAADKRADNKIRRNQ